MQQVYRETERFITIKQHYNLDAAPHVHERIELIFVLNGSGIARCDGKEIPLKSGSFFLVFPNQVHSYSGYNGKENNIFYKVIISPSHLFAFSSYFHSFVPESPLYTPSDSFCEQLLRLLIDKFTQNADEDVIKGMLTSLFGELLEHYTLIPRTAAPDKAAEVLIYCQQHFKEHITVDSLCKSLYISRSYVSYIFNKRLGLAFPDYINSLRIDEALRCLKGGGHTVEAAAYAAGFSGIRNFNHAFKKRYGVTPTQYIKRQ